MSPRAPFSLRKRLLWFLLAAILVTATAQALIAYRTAREETDELFDYQMQQMAASLGSGRSWAAITGPIGAQDEVNLDFIVQAWTADGKVVFESAHHAALPQQRTTGFSTLQARGTTYRVYVTRSPSQSIQVAQDMSAREQMASTLAQRTVAPIALMVPILMLVVWWVVGASLATVSRVRDQVARRQPDDLTKVSEEGLPEEVLPLVEELNLLFRRVRAAFAAQTDFVADAAHELRSPLAALRLQAQGLQRAADDAARAVAVRRLTAGIDRATRLVEQLLMLARHQAFTSSSGKKELLSLCELLKTAIGDSYAAAHAADVDLGLVQADEGLVSGHLDALRALIRNLLDNALKYTPPGGTVDAYVCRDGERLILGVEDSGPGIPAEDHERVLDRFYRVAGTQGTGSGLGLAIVKAAADLHGATLRLGRSDRRGGLRIEACFPRAG